MTGDCCHKAAMFEKLIKLAKRENVSKFHEVWKVEVLCEPGMDFLEAVSDAVLTPAAKGDDE